MCGFYGNLELQRNCQTITNITWTREWENGTDRQTVENYHLWMGFYVISNASKSSDGLLESLDPNKANGHDGISAKILKTGAEEISLSLSTIYNSCIKKGQCPCDWKKGDCPTTYRKHNSCETTLIGQVEDWKLAEDNRLLEEILSTDMSKAFDSLHPPLMLRKLKAYGFQDRALDLLRSYLCKRLGRVHIGSVTSS